MDARIDMGNEYSQLVNKISGLIEQSINNESALRETNRLILDQAARIKALEEGTLTANSDISEVKGKIETIENSVRQIAQRECLSPILALTLKNDLHEHAEFFKKPHQKDVHYTHYVGWPIRFLALAYILLIVFAICWEHSWEQAKSRTENDLKWRSAKMIRDPLVNTQLNHTDSLYHADPDQFKRDVEFEERRRARLADELLTREAAEEHIRDLKSQEKRR